MSTNLKRVNLMLDEAVLTRLRKAAEENHVSLSSMARMLLARQLGAAVDGHSLQRIRGLREALPPMRDSAADIRKARNTGW